MTPPELAIWFGREPLRQPLLPQSIDRRPSHRLLKRRQRTNRSSPSTHLHRRRSDLPPAPALTTPAPKWLASTLSRRMLNRAWFSRLR